jgi:hypothetical protein
MVINLENNNAMRTRAKENGLEVTCVAGTSAVILSIDMPQQQTEGLLGFSIEREDLIENEKYFLKDLNILKKLLGAQ